MPPTAVLIGCAALHLARRRARVPVASAEPRGVRGHGALRGRRGSAGRRPTWSDAADRRLAAGPTLHRRPGGDEAGWRGENCGIPFRQMSDDLLRVAAGGAGYSTSTEEM